MDTPAPSTPHSCPEFPNDGSATDAHHPVLAAISVVTDVAETPTPFLAQPFADTVVDSITLRGRLGSVWSAKTFSPDGLDRRGA